MEIKQLGQILNDNLIKIDSLDIPDCFGEFNKKKQAVFKILLHIHKMLHYA